MNPFSGCWRTSANRVNAVPRSLRSDSAFVVLAKSDLFDFLQCHFGKGWVGGCEVHNVEHPQRPEFLQLFANAQQCRFTHGPRPPDADIDVGPYCATTR